MRLRRPTEADHARILPVVDDWWGGRPLHHLLPRLWLQHFTGTSWVAETADGRLAGFLIGFISPDHSTTGYIHMVATSPNLRRQGLGRRMYEAFIEDVRDRGVLAVQAITWAGNRTSLAFHASMGFRIHDGPGTRRVFGVPAFVDYEGAGSDICLLELDLGPRRG
jgi:ribosomal protein S18 acetylase RimI-like enzyme